MCTMYKYVEHIDDIIQLEIDILYNAFKENKKTNI